MLDQVREGATVPRSRPATVTLRTVALLLVSLPFALALLAVRYAPPAHVEVAGQDVSVRPVLGQDTTRLFGGALVRPEHRHLGLPGVLGQGVGHRLGVDVGLDIDADWNQLKPSDKQTRDYLLGLWENPRPAMDRIRETAQRHLLLWGGGAFLAGLVVGGVVVLLHRHRRSRLAAYPPEEAQLVDRHNRRLRRSLTAVGVALVLAVDVLAAQVYLHRDHHVVVADPALDGTGLAGTQVNGLVADLLPWVSVVRPRSEFYNEVSRNLGHALRDRPDLRPGDGEVGFVLAEDFEDVNGMARAVGRAATLLDSDFLALSGDLTFAGTLVETYLLDTIDFYSEHRPVYLAPGLHDTHRIVEAARARGWHVADGETLDVAGLTLLPVADPRISTVGALGTGTVPRDPEDGDVVDLDAFVDETRAQVCAETPDFVLLHDHRLGRQIAEAGCQRIAVLDGRSFEFLGPRRVTTDAGSVSTELTIGSAGGHTSTKPDPGVIKHPARFAVLVARPETGASWYAVVTVHPDAAVTVTPRAPLTAASRPTASQESTQEQSPGPTREPEARSAHRPARGPAGRSGGGPARRSPRASE